MLRRMREVNYVVDVCLYLSELEAFLKEWDQRLHAQDAYKHEGDEQTLRY